MSLKGFQKSVLRAPQTVKQRFNMGEITKDAVYSDSERRFQEIETETNKLHNESRKYFEAINGMLTHQIEFSKAIAEIYKPISGRVSDPDSTVPDGNPEGIRACEEYEAIVQDLQATLQPELEMIDARIIKPAMELLEVSKVMRKSATKRDHKQLDYDRHRATLKKLQEKKDKTLKDEKALFKAENDVEAATQEYNYFNDLMKDELPKLFALVREFIQPLFQSFYYMQLNVFYTLHEKMQSIDIGYFNLTLDIEDAFEMKRGDAQEQAESLGIVKFKTTGGKTRASARQYPLRPAIEGSGHKPLAIEASKTTTSPNPHALSRASMSADDPPPYAAPGNSSASHSGAPTATTVGVVSGWQATVANKAKPPPPKPKPGRLSNAQPVVETVTALYDYEAQAAGDLSFSAGETIEIVQRTGNENEWWTGRVGGREGQFPGNYVQLN